MNTFLPSDIDSVVRYALAEDIGNGDITTQLIPAKKLVSARIISREDGVLCGSPWVNRVFSQLDNSIAVKWQLNESETFTANQVLAQIDGSARPIMSGERTALNFLQLLSGTAS